MNLQICRKTGNNELRAAIAAFPVALWLGQQGIQVHDTGGRNIQINCPVCRGRWKLGISRQKKVAQCFKCSEGGAGGAVWNGKADLLKLIILLEGGTFRSAVQRVYALSGMPEPKWERPESIDRGIPDDAVPLWETHAEHPSRQMMMRRGMDHLSSVSHVCVTGEYEGRVILPAMWFNEVEGWEAKAYLKMQPKSLFPDWFETGHSIYTTRQWDCTADFCVITESIFDAETFGVNALGIYGSTLREGQVKKLHELAAKGVRRLVWALDFDAWKKQGNAILSWTAMHFDNLIAMLPEWKDPNQIGREACWKLVQSAQAVRDSTDISLLGLDR